MTTTLTTSLTDAVRELHAARQSKAAVDAALAEKRGQFASEHAALIATQKEITDAVAAAEATVKTLARAQYDTTQDRKPAPGVEVKLFATMTYDEAEAFAFAKQSGLALVPEKLDRAAFEKIAKATPLPFVQYDQEPRVTVASDLAKVLPADAPTSDADPFA